MTMDWVKSRVGYYRHLAIATGSDALEVMFKRADALAGELGEEGFVPDAMLPLLCRRPAQAKRLAGQLVDAGLWDKVKGGYLIVDWAEINAEAVRLTQKKKRDRERKRADRAASRESGQSDAESVDASADSPRTRPRESLYESESQSQSKTAAAAAGATAAATLPGPIDVLRAKLQAHTPLRALRFDTLTADQIGRLDVLIGLHGDEPLVRVAVDTCRNPPPVSVGAFLGTWEALAPPGERRLAVVRQQLCDTHQTVLSSSGTCSACVSDRKAAR